MTDIPPRVRTDLDRDTELDHIYNDVLPSISESLQNLWDEINEDPRFRWGAYLVTFIVSLAIGRFFWHWIAFSNDNFALWLPHVPGRGVHYYERFRADELMNRVWLMSLVTALIATGLSFMLIRPRDEFEADDGARGASFTDQTRRGIDEARRRIEQRRQQQADERARRSHARQPSSTFTRPTPVVILQEDLEDDDEDNDVED